MGFGYNEEDSCEDWPEESEEDEVEVEEKHDFTIYTPKPYSWMDE